MRPLIVGQITGVSQFAAVIAPAVLCRPHRWPSSNQATTLESQPIQGIQYVSGQTLTEMGVMWSWRRLRSARGRAWFWLSDKLITTGLWRTEMRLLNKRL